jgi:sec-independent protein translocase protein TatA
MLAQIFAFLDLDTPDLLIILVIVLLLFGGRKLPELSRSIGQSMRELRKGISGGLDEDKPQKKDDDKDASA